MDSNLSSSGNYYKGIIFVFLFALAVRCSNDRLSLEKVLAKKQIVLQDAEIIKGEQARLATLGIAVLKKADAEDSIARRKAIELSSKIDELQEIIDTKCKNCDRSLLERKPAAYERVIEFKELLIAHLKKVFQ